VRVREIPALKSRSPEVTRASGDRLGLHGRGDWSGVLRVESVTSSQLPFARTAGLRAARVAALDVAESAAFRDAVDDEGLAQTCWSREPQRRGLRRDPRWSAHTTPVSSFGPVESTLIRSCMIAVGGIVREHPRIGPGIRQGKTWLMPRQRCPRMPARPEAEAAR
jgi:hypothetical protein